MRKNFFLIIIFCGLIHFGFSQKEVVVEGEYQAEWLNSESRNEAETRIKNQAIVNALEKAFGKAIFQGNSTFIQNVNSGNKTETKTGFNMIADSYVKGEVLEELAVKWEEIKGYKIVNNKKTDVIELKCSVKIRAREYVEPPVEFTVFPMNCLNPDACKTTRFKNNEDFYLYFKSPVKGYVAVFLDDNDTSFILLPYTKKRSDFAGGFPVEAMKEYIFFKNDKKYFDPATTEVDELQWDSRNYLEKIYVIFSTEPLVLPSIKATTRNIQNLPSADFNKWLIKLRKSRTNVQYQVIPVDTKH